MPTIVIAEDQLYHRPAAIRRLLRPLRAGRDVPTQFYAGPVQRGKIIGAHEGALASSSYRNWHFRTFVREFWCQYFELWYLLQGKREWYLDRAYLNVFRLRAGPRVLEEFVCVHCDPDDDGAEPLRSYKRGPHLHVIRAEAPIPKSHFPLNLGHLKEVLVNVETLSRAIEQAVRVVCEEVLRRC